MPIAFALLPELASCLLVNTDLYELTQILQAIYIIQANCQFYNYEIFCSPPAPPQAAPAPVSTIHVVGDYVAGDKLQGDKIAGNKAEFPNATEVKIFENVQNYHESPPQKPPS